MEIFRADLYVKFRVQGFDLVKSSQQAFQILNKVSDIQNLKMTKVKRDREEQGKIKIEEWYEMTGSIAVTEGGKAFWVLCKPISSIEPYNFFMRLDRNITASDYDSAQSLAVDWVKHKIIQPFEAVFKIEGMIITSPSDLSTKAKTLREAK